MDEYNIENKRDIDGTLIGIKLYPDLKQKVDQTFEIIKTYETYEKIIKILPKVYVDLYFKKFIFFKLYEIHSKIVIKKFDNSKNKILIVKNNFPSKKILKNIYPKENFLFKKNLTQNLKNYLKKFKSKFTINIYNTIINNFFFVNNKKINLSVNIHNKLNLNKQNNLYWFDKQYINQKEIILYFETKVLFLENKIYIKKLKKKYKHIKIIKLWGNKFFNSKKFFKNFKNNTKNLKEEEWFIQEAQNLMNETNFWYNFFK